MAPPPAPWADGLAIDLLLLILAELYCRADRASFASVCRHWRQAAKLAVPQLPQIPFLLLPAPSPTPSIFSFLSGLRRRIGSFPADFARERFSGSHPGGWVAVALGPFGPHQLFSIFSKVRVSLPHRLFNVSRSITTPLLIRAVILSAAPTASSCVAGAMVCGASNVAFCRPGVDTHWYLHREVVDDLQDMAYYEGEAMQGFHVLTEHGDVLVLTFNVIRPRITINNTRSVRYMMAEQAPVMDLDGLPEATSRTGYLVVSRKKLLMVLRYFLQDAQTGARRTFLFRVFEMQVKASRSGINHRASWMELDGLDGRVLFVGRGCSRACEASELRGFNGGSIYFLDDAKFDLLPFLQNEPEFPCRDMGMYSMSDGTTIVRPSLDAPTPNANMRPAIYGAKNYLSWVDKDEGNEEAGKITGTRWSILSEPVSKFSPPIWFCP